MSWFDNDPSIGNLVFGTITFMLPSVRPQRSDGPLRLS